MRRLLTFFVPDAALIRGRRLFELIRYAVSVFEFPTLVSEQYLSFGSVVFPCNCIKYQHDGFTHLKGIILMLVF